MFRFFVATTPHNVKLMADITNYLKFALTLFLGFGVAFETPVAVVLLVLTDLLSLEKLRKARGYVLIIVFVIAAILTPPDVMSQTAMAVPMYLLYEGGLLFASILHKEKAEGEAAAAAASASGARASRHPRNDRPSDYRSLLGVSSEKHRERYVVISSPISLQCLSDAPAPLTIATGTNEARNDDQGYRTEMVLIQGRLPKTKPPSTNSSTHALAPAILTSWKRRIGHAADTRDEGREGAHDRHESRQHHRERTVALKVTLGAHAGIRP